MTTDRSQQLLLRRLALWGLLFLLSASARAQVTPPLGVYGANLKETSVSGLSSGAFMATQFDTAFSNELIGAGIVAGGPFYCAGLFVTTSPMQAAVTECMNPLGDSGPQATEALAAAQAFAANGEIDSLDGLARQRIYVFSGTMDKVVSQKVVDQTAQFFRLAGVSAEHLKYVKNISAGHAIITDSATDNPCGQTKDPFINNCGFVQSHDILNWIYPNLNPPASVATGKLIPFDQSEFDPKGIAALGQIGYLYLPRSCETEACRIHVVFHGCLQGERKIGDRYARSTGYDEMADTNGIIVLYPQVKESSRNPQGCWDFWGYTAKDDTHNPDFYSRKAPQMAAVMQMIKRLGTARHQPHL